MTTLSNLLDDLRLRLNDVGDTQVTKTNKILMLNHGLRAMYPTVYRTAVDATITLAADTYEYTFAAANEQGRLLNVEVEETGTDRFIFLEDAGFEYRIVRRGTANGPYLELYPAPPTSYVGQVVRASLALPFASLAADGDVTDVPDTLVEAPVLYAMGIATGLPLDDRLAYKRYSTTAGQNAVFPREIMEVSQFWFGQFEDLVGRHAMPTPGAGF